MVWYKIIYGEPNPLYTKYLPPKFWSVSLYDQPFSRHQAEKGNKKPRGFDAVLDTMSDNDDMKLDNIEI